MSRKAQIHEPLSIQPLRHFLQQHDLLLVGFNQIIIGCKYFSYSGLHLQRWQLNLQFTNCRNIHMCYCCSIGSTQQTILLFRCKQEICQEIGINQFLIRPQQHRTLSQAYLFSVFDNCYIASRSLTRKNQIVILRNCTCISLVVDTLGNAMNSF